MWDEVLTALFWPEEPESRARTNLRQTLHQLCKQLGDLDKGGWPFLLVTRQDLQLNPRSDYEVDVLQFLAAVDDHDLQTAVSILSFIYHNPESVPFYMDEIDNGLPHFEEMLDPAAFSQAWQAGKSMDFETAVLQTRALLQPS